MDYKYSIILGNLGNTCDRFCPEYKSDLDTLQMLKQAANIKEVSGVELVGTWDIRPDNADEMKTALNGLGLECVSIIPDIFTDKSYGQGSYSNRDAKIRQKALDYTRQICEIAEQIGCKVINIWPGQDGYDYLLSADYDSGRKWMGEGIAVLADEFKGLQFALEYKPKEPRTHSYLARMADTLLLVQETGRENVGVTIDTGHAFVAGEVVAESIVLAHRAGGKLFHMHFNDNYASWDDDMIVGSVHSTCYIEILHWLDRTGYEGWLSMDQYPYREDAVGALTESILWLEKFRRIATEHREDIGRLIADGDPVATSRFLRGVLA